MSVTKFPSESGHRATIRLERHNSRETSTMIRIADINPAPQAAKLAAARAALVAIGQPAIEPAPLVDTTKTKPVVHVVHAVVHAPKRKPGVYRDPTARRAYKADHERKRRAAAKVSK